MYDVGLKKYEGESMDACVGWRGKAPNKMKITISGAKHEQNIWMANFKQFLLMQNMNDRPLGWIEPSKDCWATCAQKDPIGKVDIPWTQGTLRSYIVLVDQHRSFIFIRLKSYTKWPKSSSESQVQIALKSLSEFHCIPLETENLKICSAAARSTILYSSHQFKPLWCGSLINDRWPAIHFSHPRQSKKNSRLIWLRCWLDMLNLFTDIHQSSCPAS